MIDEDLHALEVQAMKEEEAEREKARREKEARKRLAVGTLPESVAEFPQLTAIELMRLRMAQVNEEKCANFFGLTVERFREELGKDEDLQKIFDAGSGRGKAEIQKAQYDAALSGDPTSLKHFGEHHLDQKSKITHEMDLEMVNKAIKMLEAKLGQAVVTKLQAPAIEAEFEEIDDVGE